MLKYKKKLVLMKNIKLKFCNKLHLIGDSKEKLVLLKIKEDVDHVMLLQLMVC